MNKQTDNLVHIKFEYDLALKTKRDIISSELDLVRMFKILQRYKDLRSEELKIREMLSRRLRVLKINMGTLQNLLPGTRAEELVDDIYREHKPASAPKRDIAKKVDVLTATKPTKDVQKKAEPEDDLESQLAEIQNRLSSLQA